MQKTNDTFKMLYVLAIFMIVDGHIGGFDYLNFHELLPYQNFHIALFMFCSGYFFNLTRSYKEFFIHKIHKLILPLYLWTLVYGLISWYLNTYHDFKMGAPLNAYNLLIAPITDGHQFIYNMATWFLVPLFLIQTISFLILKPFSSSKQELSPVTAVIFLITALILGFITIRLAPEHQGKRDFILTAFRTFYFLPSFAFGIFYRYVFEKYDRLNTPFYLCLLLGLISVITHLYPEYRHIPSWLDYITAPAWVIYTICFTAILFWLRVAKILTPVYQKSPTLTYVANNTFDIMVHHFAGFMLIKAALSSYKDFNTDAFKTNIWYMYFPLSEEQCAWAYIIITIVIALLIGYTNRKIYDILSKTISVRGNNR